jgi:hypothetical protein
MLSTLVFASIPSSRRGRLALAIVLVGAVAVLLALSVTSAAWADSSGSSAFQNGGTNVGNALMAWGKALLFAIAAIMGIGALVKRSVGEGVTILIIVLILGAFLYDQTDTETLIRNLWGAVSGS